MTCAADVMDRARVQVSALVEREERATGSRMAAYVNVGSMIGRSESWVRKLLNRTLDNKRPDAVAWLNIQSYYQRLCESQMRKLRDEIIRTEELAGPDSNLVRKARALVGEGDGTV